MHEQDQRKDQAIGDPFGQSGVKACSHRLPSCPFLFIPEIQEISCTLQKPMVSPVIERKKDKLLRNSSQIVKI